MHNYWVSKFKKKSLKCNFIEFPSHPKKSRRKECGMDIMKTVKIGTTYKLVPNKCTIALKLP